MSLGARTVLSDSEFKSELMSNVGALRAFAISLVGKIDRADDLLQETLMKGWAARSSFAAGTNMRAWLFTILRNEFYTHFRKRKHEVEDADGQIAGSVGVPPEQWSRLEFTDLRAALMRLPDDQREAILLVGASSMSYEEAAAICGVAVGTIKSRVSRARTRLSELMDMADGDDLGVEPKIKAALAPP